MNREKVIDQLVDYLLTQRSTGSISLQEIEQAIASEPSAIADLALLSTVLLDKPSTLQAEVNRRLAYQAALQQLETYVEAEVIGEDAAILYPDVATYIQQNSTFRGIYENVRFTLEQEAQEFFTTVPDSVSFMEWYQQQVEVPVAETASATSSRLWEEMQEGISHFLIEIPILLDKTKASFGELVAPLQTQLVPAGIYRSHPTAFGGEESYTEVLELPHKQVNRSLKVLLGPVENGQGTLLIEVNMMEPMEPIIQSRVSLRDEEGGLLESTFTDEQGRAYFRQLSAAKYQVEVDRIEMFFVTLTPMLSA